MERVSLGPHPFIFFLRAIDLNYSFHRVRLSLPFPPVAICPALLAIMTQTARDPQRELDTKSCRLRRLHSLASSLRYAYTQCPLADAADSCSLITSPICCRVTLAGCIILIIFVHRTDCCVKFYFLLRFLSLHLYSTPNSNCLRGQASFSYQQNFYICYVQ